MTDHEESCTDARARGVLAVAILFGGALGSACAPAPTRERRIEHTRVHTVVGDDKPWGASSGERFALRMEASPERSEPGGLSWSTPEGWTERAPGAMRAVDFAVGAEGECYLTLLGGDGGGLEANVQRWRGQMGLQPATAEELRALRSFTFFGADGVVVDLEGTWSEKRADYRLLGVLSIDDGEARFLKFVGPAALVGAEREAFFDLARSLRNGADAPPAAAAGDTPPPELQRAAGLTWDVPADWKRTADRAFRVVTFEAGPQAVECYVTLLSGDGGGLAANLERWRGQLAANGASVEESERETLSILGGDAELVLLVGALAEKDGTLVDPAAMLGLVCLLPGQALFVKMTGPREDVLGQRAAFEVFVRSLREDR